ncbi:MAG: carbohydrate ABC transporter permease [Alphaproteobacteria bacterium]
MSGARPISIVAGASMGALAAMLAVGVWSVVAIVIGGQDAVMPLGFAFIAGLIQGGLFVFLSAAIGRNWTTAALSLVAGAVVFVVLSGASPFGLPLGYVFWALIGTIVAFGGTMMMVRSGLLGIDFAAFGRHQIEVMVIRVLRGFGLAFFVLTVAFPFYVMVMTSFKKQADLLANPLDLSIDLTQSLASLISSYVEVITTFDFGRFIIVSAVVSILTVVITLSLSIPGAYAVSRLRFPGRVVLSQSILLIYMFPAIVLVIPLYSVFSQLGLRDTLVGLLIIYPATTLPVALYMLQGYFRGLPSELEDAGLIDGCSRLGVIWRITLPLSMPAVASVALYVFMIAWNEFLFAFMFLDDPAIFTLSRGIVSLNSSEVPRQFLMAGSVIVTVPVMVIFLWFERYLVTGLTAGSVKG